ncbi:MAG: two-component system sensor histidine kinase CpxA, partial [Verrucomicrobiales bacterium]
HSSGVLVAGPEHDIPISVLARFSNFAPKLDGGRRPGRQPPMDRPRPLFFAKDDGYWLASRVNLDQRQRQKREPPRFEDRPPPGGGQDPTPDILLIYSPRLGGNDLLPDPLPIILACIGVVLLCGLFWIPFVRGATRSLAQIRDATRDVAAGQFDTIVSEERSDEIGQLGASINVMSQRLQGFVDGQQRFLGDIAHELCSPIARMQMAIGVLEQRATPEQKPRVEDVREELQHMADMVNELLSFSKASLSPESADMKIIVLAPFLHEIAEREIGTRDAEIGLEHSDGLAVVADRQLLGRAIGNLIRNAMRYAGEYQAIALDAAQDGNGSINITVRDFGPGVPEEDLPYLLDPFYRPDKARTRERGGTGLGLAIVKACIEACGGTVAYRNVDPGFEVTLSLASPRFG